MRIRNLTADSMPEAMDLVRTQLGPDAVILSTHNDGPSGKVRITAATETEDSADQALNSIEAQFAAIDRLTKTLTFHRLPESLANRLLTVASRLGLSEPALALGGAFDAAFNFAKLTDLSYARPIMLVGAPGAGKTSTAAKLSALARLADCQVHLITLDSIKAGGMAQITAYGEALGAEVTVAADPEELLEQLHHPRPNTLTLIDTVGANPFDPQELARLKQIAARSLATALLVLPAGGDAVESAEIAMVFSEIGVRALISTKLDVSRRLGGLLAALHASGLPLLAVAQSAQIVEALRPVNPMSLARLVFDSGDASHHSSALTGEFP